MRKITLALTLFIVIALAGCAENSNNNKKIEKTVASNASKKGEIDSQEYLKQNRNISKAFNLCDKVEKSNDYILPNSSSELITEEMLEKLDKNQLDLARNEIYARHGYSFTIKEYKEYFAKKSWYKEDLNFSEAKFNEIEKKNLKKINSYVDSLNGQIKVPNNFGDYDLNNDGALEKLTLIFKDNSTKFSLSVNDCTIEQTGTNFENTMFIYDILTGDNRLEIAIVDVKAKDVYETSFYEYNGNKVICVGRVMGNENTIKITGNGKVLAKENSKLLTNLLCDVVYQLTGSEGLVKAELGSSYKINLKLKLKEDLTILISKFDNQKTFTIKKNDDVTLESSDDIEWISVVDSAGNTGWIRITEPNKIDGKNYTDVFLETKFK